jgi:hypothetical protein
MGLANKAVEKELLFALTDEVKDVGSVSIEDVLTYMRENRIVKITVAGEKYRVVFPLPDTSIYEKQIGVPGVKGKPDTDKLVQLTDEVKDVAGVGIDDVLSYMGQNLINKIVPVPSKPNTFRIAFADAKFGYGESGKNVYEKSIK